MSKLKNLDDSSIHYGPYARYIKRPLDFIICLLTIIILSPVLLILCLLVRKKLGSPVFFKQTRCGRDEKPFEMIKFRTMTDARDENGNLLPDTDRFTKFGDFLRNYSLDELPELLNVIKGDMSIIGPRPLYTFYVPYYTEEEALRHAVRGGITGLAQVNGRALCRWNERFAYDVEYARNITFLNDVKILWKTVYKVFKKSDIGVPSVTDEGGLHIIREVQRPDRVNEIGSTFSATDNGKESKNYPVFITKVGGGKRSKVFLSTGRSCIREILSIIDVDAKHALIPAFTCESVIEPFIEQGYEVQPYSLNEDLTVDMEKLNSLLEEFKPSVMIFHRYFGFDTCKGIDELIKNKGIITIEDETQYMFSEPRYTWTDYQIGSIRKWGPFVDGAYLISKELIIEQPQEEDRQFVELEKKAMNKKQAYLDKRSADSSYQALFAEGRKYIDKQKKTYSISCSTNYALETIDVSRFVNTHRANAQVLIDGLMGYSWFDCVFKEIPDGITPFMIPLLVHEGRKEFQSFLASQKIYATIIWGCPEEIKDKIGITDNIIYDEILCIPCDQRYSGIDMLRIVSAVKSYDKKRGNSNE